MLLQLYRDPDSDKVSHEGEEVREDLRQMVATSNSTDSVDDDNQGVQEDARNAHEPGAQDLKVNTTGVGGWDHVCDETEGDDHSAEFAEAADGSVAFDDQGALRDGVGGSPSWDRGDAATKADADDKGVGKGGHEADHDGEEDFPAWGGLGIVDEVVCTSTSVSDSSGKVQREEGKPVAETGERGIASGLGGKVKALSGYTGKDGNDNNLWNPGVAFVVVYNLIAKASDRPSDDGHDHNADDDRHAIVGGYSR